MIKEAVSGLDSVKAKLNKLQFRIQTKEYNQFKRKLDELSEYFRKFDSKKISYEEQPLIDSFNMDDLVSQQTSSAFKPFQDSQNANSFMSQSILKVNKTESRSKSLKPIKDPVCFVKPKKPRTGSVESSRKSLHAQFVIPDSQSIFVQNLGEVLHKPNKLTIRLIQDEELIPLSNDYWDNLSNGKIDLKIEFEKDFDF